ncbi:hypothetical protein HYFRA_00002408 [Hymenoscyphus fraxineus]|uniref:Uncharacterized protein n=1 Tax=Hymenoscyphus fraxineus TaxID=746836 RepID=A0A9N9L9A6_9HELO|nr:hypothetical protein HYFRA_00002408 [Hymenoscyphus fraxineus]
MLYTSPPPLGTQTNHTPSSPSTPGTSPTVYTPSASESSSAPGTGTPSSTRSPPPAPINLRVSWESLSTTAASDSTAPQTSTALVLHSPRVASDSISPHTSTTLVPYTPTSSRVATPSTTSSSRSSSTPTIINTPTSSQASGNPFPPRSLAAHLDLAAMPEVPSSPVSIPESQPTGKAGEIRMLGAYLSYKKPHPPAHVLEMLCEDTGLSEIQVLAFWQLEWLRTKWGAEIWDTLDIHCKKNQRFIHNPRAKDEFALKTGIDIRYVREFCRLKKVYDDPTTVEEVQVHSGFAHPQQVASPGTVGSSSTAESQRSAGTATPGGVASKHSDSTVRGVSGVSGPREGEGECRKEEYTSESLGSDLAAVSLDDVRVPYGGWGELTNEE